MIGYGVWKVFGSRFHHSHMGILTELSRLRCHRLNVSTMVAWEWWVGDLHGMAKMA